MKKDISLIEQKTLKNFIGNTQLPFVMDEKQYLQLKEILPSPISNKKKIINKKIDELNEISLSEKFISKISEEIGQPKESESEDEFVKRGLDVIKDRLKKYL